MKKLSPQELKEIAEQLDCGFRCFIHLLTVELVFVPDTLRFPEMETEEWVEELEKIDHNREDYFEVVAMQANDSFQVMADFTDLLMDGNPLKKRLIRILNNHKPFRGFKFEIDNSGEFRQQWFDFKNSKLIEWVTNQINAIP